MPRTETIAGETWQLEAMPSFEAAWDGMYDELGDWGDAAAREDLSPMFGVVWGSARVLAHRLATGPALTGLRGLELGCGLALPSMVAARRGADMTATDQHGDVPALLERNLARNGLSGRVRFAPLDWRAPRGLPEAGFDFVMASDVLYESALPPLVAAMFARYLRPGGLGWLLDPGRPWLTEFEAAARALGLAVAIDADDDGAGSEAFVLVISGGK